MKTVNSRSILLFALGVPILLGLVAGLFTGAMEKALSRPAGTQRVRQTQGNALDQQANVLAIDTFQRADQALWGRASDGHQWGGDANVKPFFSIQGGKGRVALGRGPLDAVIGPPTDSVDVTMSGSVNQFGNTANLGVVLRWADPNNWYKAFIDGNKLAILKSVNGQKSLIEQMDVKASVGIAQTLRFRALGALFFAKVWPSNTTEPERWMLVASDATFSAGQCGIRVFVQPETVITVLSFEATAVSGVG
jgi:hypothetical protein